MIQWEICWYLNKRNLINRLLHTVLFVFLALSLGFSQANDPILIIGGTVRDNYGKKLSGVKVAIKKDNQPTGKSKCALR